MMYGGHPLPIVTLGKRLHSKKDKKWGPNCEIAGWREINDRPAPEAPRQIEQQAAAVAEISKPAEPPAKKPAKKSVGKSTKPTGDVTLSDMLNDDLPDFVKK